MIPLILFFFWPSLSWESNYFHTGTVYYRPEFNSGQKAPASSTIISDLVFVPDVIDPAGVAYGSYNVTQFRDKSWSSSSTSSRSVLDDAAPNFSGWSFLKIWANATMNPHSPSYFSDEVLGAAVGFLEGALTHDTIRISQPAFRGAVLRDRPVQSLPHVVIEFVESNEAWIRENVETRPESTYWRFLGSLIAQAEGLVAGYNHVVKDKKDQMSMRDFWFMLFPAELGDLFNLEKENRFLDIRSSDLPSEEFVKVFDRRMLRPTHCSALAKVTPTDLLFAHTTWDRGSTMTRIFKEMTIPYSFSRSKTGAKTVQFSSYPGSLVSQDSMYSTSEGLVTSETTNEILFSDLWDRLTTKSVLTWMRILAANWLSSSAKEFTDYVALHNSGTYNNQWIVLDFKKFVPGEAIREQTLMITEEMPGLVVTQDLSDVLEKEGHFPSYNVPRSKRIFNESGYAATLEKYPILTPRLSYEHSTRANVFREREKTVVDMDHLKSLIRYNDYKHDPFELGCPALAICTREDLPPSKPYYEDTSCELGTDGKAVSFSRWNREKAEYEWNLIVGPMSGGESDIPVFDWRTSSACNKDWLKHDGQPNTFEGCQWFLHTAASSPCDPRISSTR